MVKRTVNGATRRCIEFVDGFLEEDADPASAYFLDCGQSLDLPKPVTGAGQTNPVVLTVPGHGFSNGESVDVSGITGMTELNGARYTIGSATADTFELIGVDGSGFAAYAAGGEVRAGVSAVSDLDHLEGELVSVMADGAVHAPKTVTSGAITLDAPASRVHAGYGYTTDDRDATARCSRV